MCEETRTPHAQVPRGPCVRRGCVTSPHDRNMLDPKASRAVDLVDRPFYAEAPDRLWGTDIAPIRLWVEFLYLATALNVHSPRDGGAPEGRADSAVIQGRVSRRSPPETSRGRVPPSGCAFARGTQARERAGLGEGPNPKSWSPGALRAPALAPEFCLNLPRNSGQTYKGSCAIIAAVTHCTIAFFR